MALLNHIAIFVQDLDQSKGFYTPLMALLGHPIYVDIPQRYVGYNDAAFGLFPVTENQPVKTFVHVAFNADSDSQVDAFYKQALDLGGKCNGPPGIRAEYGPTYYSAFIHDLDGNNIEIVHWPH